LVIGWDGDWIGSAPRRASDVRVADFCKKIPTMKRQFDASEAELKIFLGEEFLTYCEK
jgi:hypothetical protein